LKSPDEENVPHEVVPVIHEVPAIGKRTVTTSSVRVQKSVVEREILIDEPLLREEVEVTRVAIGRDLAPEESPPVVRYEGETMIVPVLREVPVVTRKTVLTEEIRITRVRRQFRDPQSVQVREEEVAVVRDETGSMRTTADDEQEQIS
jgi:stress response protein YsnF